MAQGTIILKHNTMFHCFLLKDMLIYWQLKDNEQAQLSNKTETETDRHYSDARRSRERSEYFADGETAEESMKNWRQCIFITDLLIVFYQNPGK